jgi:hypothetical protein
MAPACTEYHTQPSVSSVAPTWADAKTSNARAVPIRLSSGMMAASSKPTFNGKLPSGRNKALSTKERTGAEDRLWTLVETQRKSGSASCGWVCVHSVVAISVAVRLNANGARTAC